MDHNFFHDCGLEGHADLHNELDQVQSEYFTAESVRNEEQIDLRESTDSKASRDAFEETSTEITSDSRTQQNNEDTMVDQNSADDFITPIRSFLECGCDCQHGKNNSSCTNSLCFEELVEHRMQCIELSSTKLDLVVLGALQSHMNLSYARKCHRMSYFFRGVHVCKKTFLFVYGIGKSRLENLKAHFKRYRVVPRTNANTS